MPSHLWLALLSDLLNLIPRRYGLIMKLHKVAAEESSSRLGWWRNQACVFSHTDFRVRQMEQGLRVDQAVCVCQLFGGDPGLEWEHPVFCVRKSSGFSLWFIVAKPQDKYSIIVSMTNEPNV